VQGEVQRGGGDGEAGVEKRLRDEGAVRVMMLTLEVQRRTGEGGAVPALRPESSTCKEVGTDVHK
jgi:hypothetical protein